MKPTPLTAQELNALVGDMPFNKMVGARISRVYPDGLSMELRMGDHLRNLNGTLHGGATAALIDAAVGVAIIAHTGGKRPLTTVEMKVNYLRPVQEGLVRARAKFVKFGKTLVVSSCDVKDAHGHLIATALVTYMLL